MNSFKDVLNNVGTARNLNKIQRVFNITSKTLQDCSPKVSRQMPHLTTSAKLQNTAKCR